MQRNYSININICDIPKPKNLDFFNHQRILQVETNNNSNLNQYENEKLPKQLLRNYTVRIIPTSDMSNTNMRMLQSESIGSLVKVTGTVVRSSQLRPLIQVICYYCELCKQETYQVVYSSNFLPLTSCGRSKCAENNKKGNLRMYFEASK